MSNRTTGASHGRCRRRSAAALAFAGMAAIAGLLLPSSASAETSTRQHTPKGTFTFQCNSPNLRVFGSESAGYSAVVLNADISGTHYFAGDSNSGAPADVTYDHGQLTAAIPVRTSPVPSAPPVGLLTITADLAAERMQVLTLGGAGSGDANQQTVFASRYRRLTPVGSVQITAPDGAQAAAIGCSGTLDMGATSVVSDPHATVTHQTFSAVSCEPITVGEHVYSLGMADIVTPPESAHLDLVEEGPDGELLSFATGSPGDGSGLASWSRGVSFDLNDGEGVVAATADVRFAAEQSSTFPVYSGTRTARVDATIGRLEGTLAFPDGAVVPLSCDAYSADDEVTEAGGAPSTNAPPPSNDLPANALPLAAGARATAQTAGAAPGPETPLECMVYESGADAVTNTVWYTVMGDGPVTIDTAGTRFDTAIAVYRADGAAGLTPVPDACVDDTFTPFGPLLLVLNLQASVTFDAQPGVEYFVQVGGTDADQNFGTLQVSAH